MKNLLLACLMVFSCLYGLPAQGFDFAPVGAKWYYSEYYDVPPSIIPHIMECTTKEMFQGKFCSKLVTSSVGPLPSPIHVYTQNDTVFFYSAVTNQFEMLYDFSAKVGDWWVVGGILSHDDQGNPIYADTIKVDSISNISINGEDLKVWHISHGFFYDWGNRIFEKAGNAMLFAPKIALGELGVWGLRCFENPDKTYRFVPYPCDTSILILGTNDLSPVNRIFVLPNPFRKELTVSFQMMALGEYFFLLFDEKGRLLIKKQLFWDNTEFETDFLPAGIYFWEIIAKGKLLKSGKAIKIEK